MSDQRIDTGAEAATSTDADPGEGQGAAGAGVHADPLDPMGQRASGDDGDMPQPTADRPAATPGGGTDIADIADSADTEGASALRDAEQAAAEQQRGGSDLSGRSPA